MQSTDTRPTSASSGPAAQARNGHAGDAAWSGCVALEHWSLIRVRGADAAPFLHSQLTNAFTGLGDGTLRLAGFCSAKGRLQASFHGWQPAPEEILLACHASVAEAARKRMSMFVLRSKCKLSDAGPAGGEPGLVCTGLVGAVAEQALAASGLADGADWRQHSSESGSLLRLPAVRGLARAVWVAAPGVAAPAGAASKDAGTVPTLDNWRWLEVHSGVAVIEAETVDQFVPQMVNFELTGGVDFQKGCYPGQEVVARSQYRGTVKRRMFLFEANGVCTPGQEVFHSSDVTQPAGMVVNAAPRPGASGNSALVEIKLAALALEGSLHLDGVDGPLLTQADLPYPVPMGPGDDPH